MGNKAGDLNAVSGVYNLYTLQDNHFAQWAKITQNKFAQNTVSGCISLNVNSRFRVFQLFVLKPRSVTDSSVYRIKPY